MQRKKPEPLKDVIAIIDFHCHILPGLDDGAGDWEESVAMARFLETQGVTGIVATPHYLEGYYTPEAGEILDKTEELQKQLAQAGINIKVYPGCEAHISYDLPELVQQRKVLTVNNGGKYLLVELPFHELPLFTKEILFRLKINGVTPVIAHPERNEVFAANPAKLTELILKGCLAQMNAGSIIGFYGRKIEKAAKQLMRARTVQFLGSDLHGQGLREIPLNSALTAIAGMVEAEEGQQLRQIRANYALAGYPVDTREPEEPMPESGLWKQILDRLLG